MHEIIDTFIANLTLIVAFMYSVLKLKEYVIHRVKKVGEIIWIVPFLMSILSIWVMHHPLLYEGMRIDLRGIPILFISYLGGWKLGFLSILLPTWFRLDMGGTTVLQGITLAIFLPFIIGALFHERKMFTPPYTILNLKRMLLGFIIYECIKSIMTYWTTPATITTILIMCIFEFIALITIGVMNNDTNRNYLLRKELEFHSRHDNMTSIYNLRYFKSKVDELMEQDNPFFIAMFDVDFFKTYNDTHGHPAGDSVLRTIGQLLNDSMREEDVFARYGGEEFIICIANVTNVQTAYNVADRFRNLVKTYPFYGEEQQPEGKLTISVGLSDISRGRSLESLIDEADKALYKSKKEGRNKVTIYNQ